MPKGTWRPVRVRKVVGVPPPMGKRGRPQRDNGAPAALMRMQVGDCYDIDRGEKALEELARRLRRIYDVDRRWTVRPSGKPGWSRIWRVF
jgi:hypothetical protein